MIREEAIDLLDNLLGMVTDNHEADYDEAIKMAIQALSQEPTTTTNNNEPMTMVYPTIVCTDAISREAVLDGLKGCICEEWIKTLFATMVKQLPSVTHKSGKWIKLFLTDTGDIDGQCSECGFIHKFIDGHTAQYNYCPNCGAKMESEDKE